MKAEPLSLGKILSENQRFVVPIYQRRYTWSVKEQIAPLWEQVESKADELLSSQKVQFPHYMGSLLVVPENEAAFGQLQAYDVVDGQQRITTFNLLFAALRAISRELQYTELTKSLESLLFFPDEPVNNTPGSGRYKLQPTKEDRKIFRQMVDLSSEKLRESYPDHFYPSGKVKKTKVPPALAAYCYFYDHAWIFLDVDATKHKERFQALTETIFQSFRLIVITLSQEDDPQVIFETLNTGGAPLAAMDLVRNDVFLRATRMKENAEALMDNYWSVFQSDFWREIRTQGRLKKPTMDFFLTHALSAETGLLISPSEIYSEYKKYSRSLPLHKVEQELINIVQYAQPYTTLVTPQGTSALDDLARLLEIFDTSTAFPTVLLTEISAKPEEIKERIYKLIASYIVRRALCGLTSKNYNIVFRDLTLLFRTAGVSEESFALLFDGKKDSDAALFPTNSMLQSAFTERNQYYYLPTSRLRFVLYKLELAMRDKFSASSDLKPGLWVEHLMPQSWRENWPLLSAKPAPPKDAQVTDIDLSAELARREMLIHTMGNLTLLTPASNASAGYASFNDKKNRLLGSLTAMNAGIAKKAKWDEFDILSRSQELLELAITIWPFPATGVGD